MPITFVVLLIYVAAVVVAFIGVKKKIMAMKVVSAFLFLIGVILTVIVMAAIRSM
jgi:hypothetical protein